MVAAKRRRRPPVFPPSVIADYSPVVISDGNSSEGITPEFANDYLSFLDDVRLLETKDRKAVHNAVIETIYWQDSFNSYMRIRISQEAPVEEIKSLNKEIRFLDGLYHSLCVSAISAKNF